jgi:hypothetical protein
MGFRPVVVDRWPLAQINVLPKFNQNFVGKLDTHSYHDTKSYLLDPNTLIKHIIFALFFQAAAQGQIRSTPITATLSNPGPKPTTLGTP